MPIKPSTETKSAAANTSAANTIPAHVIERMEAEWRQMRQGGSAGSSK
ncbi:hypothetical protein M8R20_15130 [Pseudomonas sp. R2.Fl]|nr:hypothetical protein [Pseudomonas sp. R2.Fl]